MEVLFGTSSDIEQWMKLVKRVSWNFPGLETEESEVKIFLYQHFVKMMKKELLQGHYIKNLDSKKQNLLKNLVIQIKNLFYIHNFQFIKTIDEILTAKKEDENYGLETVEIAICKGFIGEVTKE